MITIRKKAGSFFNNRGFTLIEMAIVLIIIGIIIGAIVKGKDIIKSGEQKKLYTKYLNAWLLIYNSYYDRTGMILGDVDDATNGQTAGGRDGRCSVASAANLEAQLKAVGLDPVPSGTTGSILERNYKDSKGRNATVILAFDFKAPPSQLGNFIRVTGIPNELGISWDRIVDGKMDGAKGDFLYTADYTVNNPTLSAWPSAELDPAATGAAILKLPY